MLADRVGYADPFTIFESPLGASDNETYVILISNTDSNGPEIDTEDNSTRLRKLYEQLGEMLRPRYRATAEAES